MPKRVDGNQREIVNILRNLGATVQILSSVGKGCPDILVGIFGQNFLMELKNGKLSPSAQRLTEHEEKFFSSWKGQVCVVKSEEEAITFINNIHKL